MPSTPATAGVYSPRMPSTPATAGVNSPRMPSTPATAGVYSPRMPSTPATAGVYSPRMPSTPATAGVYSPIACHQRPPPRASIPLAKSITSAAGRCLFPRQIYHICRRQMSIPPRHLWRGGGRQAGGEVQNTNQAPPKTKKARHKGGLRCFTD